MPAPPPNGVSSTRPPRSGVCSRRFRKSRLEPAASASPHVALRGEPLEPLREEGEDVDLHRAVRRSLDDVDQHALVGACRRRARSRCAGRGRCARRGRSPCRSRPARRRAPSRIVPSSSSNSSTETSSGTSTSPEARCSRSSRALSGSSRYPCCSPGLVRVRLGVRCLGLRLRLVLGRLARRRRLRLRRSGSWPLLLGRRRLRLRQRGFADPQQPAHDPRGLRAALDPLACALLVDHDRRGLRLGVVVADRFDHAPVARGALVGDDDAPHRDPSWRPHA